jgi:DNA-binding transcriptional MerR regulator
MYIHELAKEANIPPQVVRYYARIGLLNPCDREENGYKIFSQSDVEKLHFIREAQKLGFTLSEIGEFIKKENHGCKTSINSAVEILRKRIIETQKKINDLTHLEQRIDGVLSGFESPYAWENLKDFVFSQTRGGCEKTECVSD